MCIPRITRVLLEGEAQQGNVLVGHGVEQTADNAAAEAALLVVVHDHHLQVSAAWLEGTDATKPTGSRET